MRAFYESCGISKHTIEAAVQLRRKRPVEEDKKPTLIKDRHGTTLCKGEALDARSKLPPPTRGQLAARKQLVDRADG